MPTKSKSRKPRSPKPAESSDIEERIRQRAFEFYVERVRIDGVALDDWLRAEGEILGAQKQRAIRQRRDKLLAAPNTA